MSHHQLEEKKDISEDKKNSTTVYEVNEQPDDLAPNTGTSQKNTSFPLFPDAETGFINFAENEFISIITFDILATISGLPAEFHRNLLDICSDNGTISSKLIRTDQLLLSVQPNTSGELRKFIDGYQQVVKLALLLQSPFQTDENISVLFSNFLQRASRLFELDIVRNSLPESIVENIIQISESSRVITEMYQHFNAGELSTEQIIPQLIESRLLPESFQTSLELMDKLIKLHQKHPLTSINVSAFSRWLVTVLQDDDAALLLNDVLPPRLQSVLVSVINGAQQAEMMRQNEASISDWLTWLWQQALSIVPEQDHTLVTGWMVSPDSPLHRLIQMAEMIYTLSLHHPLSEQQSSTSWLLDVLMDEQTHSVLGIFLPTQVSEILATSTPLFKVVNQYPKESSIRHQLSWLSQEYRSPSPELQRLLTLLPTDTFIHQLRDSIRHHAIDPEILDLLLTLVDPGISLKQKSGLLFQQLTGTVNLEQLIAAVVKNYVPGGGLMVGLWEWYQTQPEKMTWESVISQLSASLAQYWPEEAAFAENLLTGTWQQVGNKAAELITKCSPEVRWVYLRYLELSMLWAGRELLMTSGKTGSEAALTNLSESVHRYFTVCGLPFPGWLSGLPAELGLLLSLRDEINRLPRDESWLSWLSGLLEILERYPRAAKLRHKIETGVQETVRDLVGDNMSEIALEIAGLMTSRLRKPLDENKNNIDENPVLSEKEIGNTVSSGEWRRPQMRQSHHRTRAQQRRQKLRQRKLCQRGKHRILNRKVKIKHRVAERSERNRGRIISPRVIRNVALSVAGIVLFSRLGSAEAAPSINDEKWQSTGEEEIKEIDGKTYVLFQSPFDEAEYWRKIWSRLSTLGLSIAFMSVPGIIFYRFMQRRGVVHSQEGQEYNNITMETSINDSEQPFLSNTGDSRQNESRGSVFEQNTPEIIAMLTLLAGAGGYVYGREREKYHDKREEQLIDSAPVTQLVLEITPSLLESFNTATDAGMSGGLTGEEVFLLTGGAEQAAEKERRRKRETTDYVSEGLATAVKAKWKNNESFYLSESDIKNLVFQGGIDFFHKIPLIKINSEYWQFTPEKNDASRGVITNHIKQDEVKVFRNPHGKWDVYYIASVIKDGERLINKMLTFDNYSSETRTLIEYQVGLILTGRQYIEFEVFKKYLIENLMLLFFKKNKNVIVGIEILQAISEIENNDKSGSGLSQTLMGMTSKESAVPDIYYSLIEDRVSDFYSYDNAVAEYLGGQGERLEVTNMLNNGRDAVNGIMNAVNNIVDNKIKNSNSDMAFLRKKVTHTSTNDHLIMELKEKREKEAQDIEKEKNNLIKRRKEVLNILKNSSNNISEAMSDFKETNESVLKSESYYLSGIKLADSYIKSLPLDFKEYNRLMFEIIKKEYYESLDEKSNKNSLEKFRAAKQHLNSVYSSCVMLKEMLSILPGNVFSIIPKSRFVIKKYNDYRDITLMEEVATEFFNKNKSAFDAIITDSVSDNELLEVESVISAVLFYMLRKNAGKDDVEKQGIKNVINFYFNCKASEHPFKSIENVPVGYYTFKDFKKRKYFGSQYEYNEQFNFYISNYMPYDVDFHMSYLFKKENIPSFLLLSKIATLEEYYYDASTASAVVDISSSNEKGKVSAIKMIGGEWLLLILIGNSIDVKYFKNSREAEDSFLGFFIKPQRYFGKRTATLVTSEVTSTGMLYDVYPTDAVTKGNLSYYETEWNRLGYKNDGAPIFHHKTNQITKGWRDKSILSYSYDFIHDNYRQIVEHSKTSLDETGFWHHLATSVIPFYDVIYKYVTDRYYTLSLSDGMSIVTDILSIIGFLVNLGMKVHEVSEKVVLIITQKYNDYIMSGVSRNAAAIMVLRDFPTTLLKTSNALSLLKTLRNEIVSLLNPFPFDLADVSLNIYKFATSKSNGIISGIKEKFEKLPTKIKDEWKVKDPETIRLIETDSSQKDSIYTLNKRGDDENEKKYIKNGRDYYLAFSDDTQSNWFITKPVTSSDDHIGVYQEVYKKGDEWSSLPPNEGRLEDGPYRGFESTKIPISFASKFIINHSRTYKRTMSFSPELNDYRVDRDFTVVPVGPALGAKEIYLPKNTAVQALTNATNKVHELKRKWRDLELINKTKETVTNMNNIKFSGSIFKKYITSLEENDINTKFFALVKKTGDWQTDPNSVYGMATLHYDLNNSTLYFKSLSSHPYTIAAKDAVLSRFLTPEDVNKYKIKNVAMHLGTSSVRQALDHHNILPGNVRLKYFTTYTANPVTEAMVRKLQGIHGYLEAPLDSIKQRVHSTVDNLSSFISGSILRRQAVDDPATLQQLYNDAASRMLSSLPKSELSQNNVAGMANLDEFHPIKKEVYPDPELFKDYKDAGFKKYHFTEVVEDINNLNPIQLTKYGEYVNLIKSSANELVDTLGNIRDVINKSKSNPVLKGKIDNYFTDAFKLNHEVKDESMASSLSKNEVLKKISERFEDVVMRCHDYLLEQKNKRYTNFSILDAMPRSQRGDGNLNAVYAFTLHNDVNKKIYLTLNGENFKSSNLKYNIAHEATHSSSGTKDHSYFDNVRIFENKKLSDINVASSHYFSDYPDFENKAANFIFNYEKVVNLPETTRKKAMKYIENNNMVRSDLLLHTAEFDTMLIKEFDEVFCTPGRTRREAVSPSEQQPDMKNIIQTLVLGLLLN